MGTNIVASGTPMVESNVSVIVVSYNTKDKLRRCLSCIEPEHEVIVVDNASADGSPDMVAQEFPHVHLIRSLDNRGFGAANNQGLDTKTRELALFLNSDCYAEPGSIASLSKLLEDGSVIAVGGELHNPDGSLQESVATELTLGKVLSEQFLLEKLPITSSYWVTRKVRESATQECEQVMGACLLTRSLERFDERFFLYCEDTDLCYRLRKHGRILYGKGATFTHELGSSSVGIGRWKSVARYNRGKELYFAIHHGKFAASVCWLLNRSGAAIRFLVWLLPTLLTLGLMPRLRSQVGLFAKVLASPILGPDRGLHTPR